MRPQAFDGLWNDSPSNSAIERRDWKKIESCDSQAKEPEEC